MALGAVFGALNTMYSAVSERSREIAVLRAIGFGGGAIVLSFFVESLIIALVGGLVGCVAVLPVNGITTGTMNWQTFSAPGLRFPHHAGPAGDGDASSPWSWAPSEACRRPSAPRARTWPTPCARCSDLRAEARAPLPARVRAGDRRRLHATPHAPAAAVCVQAGACGHRGACHATHSRRDAGDARPRAGATERLHDRRPGTGPPRVHVPVAMAVRVVRTQPLQGRRGRERLRRPERVPPRERHAARSPRRRERTAGACRPAAVVLHRARDHARRARVSAGPRRILPPAEVGGRRSCGLCGA